MAVVLNRVYRYYGVTIIPFSGMVIDQQRITTMRGVFIVKDGYAYIRIGNPYLLFSNVKAEIAKELLEKML